MESKTEEKEIVYREEQTTKGGVKNHRPLLLHSC
jgi:hypothetical protein